MAQHPNQFCELANQLRRLSAEGKGLDDRELLTILTLSIPDSYKPLVIALQSRTDLITFDIMAGRLLQESARRHVGRVMHQTQDGSNHSGSNTPFTANRIPVARESAGRKGFHTYEREWGGYRGKTRGQYSVSGNGHPLRGSSGPVRGRTTSGTKCYYCRKEGHWKKDCLKRKSEEAGNGNNNGSREFTFLAEEQVEQPRRGWTIDSEARQHLCGDRDQFSNYTTISSEQAITSPNRTKIQAIISGEVLIATENGGIMLTGVWHVPDIGGNILLVSRIVDAGYPMEFGPTACIITKGNMRSKIGARYGRLYHLIGGLATRHTSTIIETNLGLTTNHSHSTTMEVWHRRLCHRTLDSTTVKYITSHFRDMKVTDPEQLSPTVCRISAFGR